MTYLLWIAMLAVIFAVAYRFAPKGWRTVAINRAMALLNAGLGLLYFLPDLLLVALPHLQLVDFSAFLPNWQATLTVTAINILNEYMRKRTTTPVGEKY